MFWSLTYVVVVHIENSMIWWAIFENFQYHFPMVTGMLGRRRINLCRFRLLLRRFLWFELSRKVNTFHASRSVPCSNWFSKYDIACLAICSGIFTVNVILNNAKPARIPCRKWVCNVTEFRRILLCVLLNLWSFIILFC